VTLSRGLPRLRERHGSAVHVHDLETSRIIFWRPPEGPAVRSIPLRSLDPARVRAQCIRSEDERRDDGAATDPERRGAPAFSAARDGEEPDDHRKDGERGGHKDQPIEEKREGGVALIRGTRTIDEELRHEGRRTEAGDRNSDLRREAPSGCHAASMTDERGRASRSGAVRYVEQGGLESWASIHAGRRESTNLRGSGR